MDAERTAVNQALGRYLDEVSPGERPRSRQPDARKAKSLCEHLGKYKYSVAAVTPTLVAQFHDSRLATGLANNSVRLELALLIHLYTIAIRRSPGARDARAPSDTRGSTSSVRTSVGPGE